MHGGQLVPSLEVLPPELLPFLHPDAEDAASGEPSPYRDKTPLQCLRSQSFWLIIFAYAICSGAGLTYLNNLSQVVKDPLAYLLVPYPCAHHRYEAGHLHWIRFSVEYHTN